MREDLEFILLRKGDRVRKYCDYGFKDGTVILGGKVGTSGCFVDFDCGDRQIVCPEELVKLKN